MRRPLGRLLPMLLRQVWTEWLFPPWRPARLPECRLWTLAALRERPALILSQRGQRQEFLRCSWESKRAQ